MPPQGDCDPPAEGILLLNRFDFLQAF